MSDRSTLELPFDAYQRYQLVADLVRRYPGYGAGTSVLDVGGRTALMRGFLTEACVELVDVEPAEADGLVIGCGGALPFRDGAFDVVTACDTLEHVPVEHRETFIRECARVSKGWVVLAGPYDSQEVRAAEENLRVFLKEKLALDHRYLNEHFEHGLPCRVATTETFRASQCSVASIGHANLQRWLPLMCLEMYLDSDPNLREVAKRYFRVYNESLYATDHAGPVYRHAVIAARSGVALPSTEGLFVRPVAPPEVTQMFGELFEELVAFDRERDVYELERTRLIGVNNGLVLDLDGHKETLAKLRKDLAEHEASLGTARADLVQHATSLGERTALFEAEQTARVAAETSLQEHEAALAEITARCEGQELTVESLEDDLQGHRETVSALRDELTGFRADHERARDSAVNELDAHRDVIHELRRELRSHADALADMRNAARESEAAHAVVIGEAQRVATELGEELGRTQHAAEEQATAARNANEQLRLEHERNEALEDELEDRWRCFRRAVDFRHRA